MIYFITDNHYTKIGYTEKDCKRRLRALQTGSPKKLSLILQLMGGFEKEKKIHKALRKHKAYGEWFSLPSIKITEEFIDFLLEEHNDYKINTHLTKVNLPSKVSKTFNAVLNCFNVLMDKEAFVCPSSVKTEFDANFKQYGFNKPLSKRAVCLHLATQEKDVKNYNLEMFGTNDYNEYVRLANVGKIIDAVKIVGDGNKRTVAAQAGIHHNTVGKLWDEAFNNK